MAADDPLPTWNGCIAPGLCSGLSMRLAAALSKIAENLQFPTAGQRRLLERICEIDLPAHRFAQFLARHAGMKRHDLQFVRVFRRLPDCKVCDQQLGPGRVDAESPPVVASVAKPKRREEVDALHETPARLLHDNVGFLAERRYLGRSAAAGEAHPWLAIVADDRRVDVSKSIKLGGAEKSDRDPAALKPVAEHLRSRDGCQGGCAQFSVSDRQRQHRRRCADRAGLVDQRNAGRRQQTRQIACSRRSSYPDKANVAATEGSRCCHNHHFVRCIVHRNLQPAVLDAGAKILGTCAMNMLVNPFEKAFPIAGYGIPGNIEGVVALVVPMCIGRVRTAGNH